jgi:hypothetical protein
MRIFDSLRSGDKADTCIHFCIRFPFFLLKSGDRAETSIRFENPYPQSSSQHAGKIGCNYQVETTRHKPPHEKFAVSGTNLEKDTIPKPSA